MNDFLGLWLNNIFTIKTLYCFIRHAFPSQQKPGMDLADTYIMFVRQNQDILREKINEEMYIEKLFDVSNSACKVCWHYSHTVQERVAFDGMPAKQALVFCPLSSMQLI